MDALLNWLWQGGVVATAASIMLLALDRARANIRYLVCWAASFAVMALPALSSTRLTAGPTEAVSAPHGGALVSLPDIWWTSTSVLLAAWIVWVTVHAVRFVAAAAAIRRARARALAFPFDVEMHLSQWIGVRATRRRATLVLSDSVAAAAVLGWGAPLIAVSPSLLSALEAGELDRVLIHEWAHVQRRDDLVNILQVVAYALVGWHPAMWWLDRRMRVEREMACDETTIALTGSPKTYAECLMKLASLKGRVRTTEGAPAVLTSSGLRARIVKIVSVRPSIAPLWSRSIALAIITILCVVSMQLTGMKLVEAAVLPLPLVPPRVLTVATHHIARAAVPMPSLDREADRPLRTASRVSPAAHQQPPQVSPPQPNIEPDTHVTTASGQAQDSAPPAHANPEPAVLPVLPPVPLMPRELSDVTPRAPWAAAADGGVAVGRKSKDAGVATAGFFTRFGRRVAGSF